MGGVSVHASGVGMSSLIIGRSGRWHVIYPTPCPLQFGEQEFARAPKVGLEGVGARRRSPERLDVAEGHFLLFGHKPGPALASESA